MLQVEYARARDFALGGRSRSRSTITDDGVTESL